MGKFFIGDKQNLPKQDLSVIPVKVELQPPQVQVKTEIVEIIKEIPVEKIVEVVKEIPVEVIKEVIVPEIKEIEKIVLKEVPVEVIKEIPVERIVEITKEIPVEKLVEVQVDKIILKVPHWMVLVSVVEALVIIFLIFMKGKF